MLKDKKHTLYYGKVVGKKTLHNAWQRVYSSGRKSTSPSIRSETQKYNIEIIRNINSLSGKLAKKSFKFLPAKGAPGKRPGKRPRPIVISPVENKIIQRAILDILQENNNIKQKYIDVPTSFGIRRKEIGVARATMVAQKAIIENANWCIRSDIKEFFTKIPKDKVVKTIQNEVRDDDFIELLRRAIDVELENIKQLGKYAILFPDDDIGVAQGCCLSSLLGNIFLNEFDKKMNGRGIVCLRYVDDFLILGPTRSRVLKAFKSAQAMLQKEGLSAYDPIDEEKKPSRDRKAGISETKNGINFLGCIINKDYISPDIEARERLIARIENEIKESVMSAPNPNLCYSKRKTFVDTLHRISIRIEAWGKQYAHFCKDNGMFAKLDVRIEKKIGSYIRTYFKMLKISGGWESKRRLLGVGLLRDIYVKEHNET